MRSSVLLFACGFFCFFRRETNVRFAWCWREASVRVAFGKAITRGMEKNIPKRSLDQSRFFAAQTFIHGKEKVEESPFLDEATAGMGGTQEKGKRRL